MICGNSGGFFNRLGNRLACVAEFGGVPCYAAEIGARAFHPREWLRPEVILTVLRFPALLLAGAKSPGWIGSPQSCADCGVVGSGCHWTSNGICRNTERPFAGTQTLELGIGASGRVATSIAGVSAETAASVVAAVKLGADLTIFAYGGIFKCK